MLRASWVTCVRLLIAAMTDVGRALSWPVASNSLFESSRGCPVERKSPKKVVVSKAAVKRSSARAVKASAKLEGRVVPSGHQRSAAVKAYLAKQQPPQR